MALSLNIFRTIPVVVTTTPTEIYTAPVGYTGVVLLSQVANTSSISRDVSLTHRRGATDTEMLKNYPISANDTLNLLSGKLVLESGDKLVLYGSVENDLKFIASILETLN